MAINSLPASPPLLCAENVRSRLSLPFETMDVNQVKTFLGKTKVNKLSGLDNIPSKLLKMAVEIVSQSQCTFLTSHSGWVFFQMTGN